VKELALAQEPMGIEKQAWVLGSIMEKAQAQGQALVTK
jgi:hypothetical protein